MKINYDVIIIGGGPAGVISAVTTKKYNPDKKILLIKDTGKGVIPCGIPYMFTTLKKPEENAMGNMPLEKNNIVIKIGEVVSIDKKNKKIKTKDNEEFGYNKLVLALGSHPIIPNIVGSDISGNYPIIKEMEYLKSLKKRLKKSKKIVIIGGGFIGIEFADELSKLKGVQVSIIELLPYLLGNSFDKEFSKQVKEELERKGIKIYNNLKLEKINGRNNVESVLLSNNKIISADLVIFGIGSKPNINLAKNSGLNVNRNGIIVDELLRTSNKDIFAVGDCSTKKDFFTKQEINVMLASTATTESRIASYNLFNQNKIKNKGTIASYSTKIGSLVLGSTGMNEKTAKKEKIKIIIGFSESYDKHPKDLPESKLIKMKLIFSDSEILLGGQVSGGESVGEIINILSMAIQKKYSILDIINLQIATHPKLTPAPTSYPIINAALDALKNLKEK